MNDDFLKGFLFGLAVTENAHGIQRSAVNLPKIKAVLQGIADGDITLVDSPEEAERELTLPEAKAYLHSNFRRGRQEHKEFAALVLAKLPFPA